MATFSVGFLPHLLLCGALVLLCMKQPDFGSSVLLVFLLFVLLFAAGTKLSFLVGSVLLALPLAYFAVATSPYRMKRILAFMDPLGAPPRRGLPAHREHDVHRQRRGDGAGAGDGRQKLFFLPEAHTDFIFSIIRRSWGSSG